MEREKDCEYMVFATDKMRLSGALKPAITGANVLFILTAATGGTPEGLFKDGHKVYVWRADSCVDLLPMIQPLLGAGFPGQAKVPTGVRALNSPKEVLDFFDVRSLFC